MELKGKLGKLGRAPRDYGPWSATPNKRPRGMTPLLAWLRATGGSVQQISNATGYSLQTVYQWLYGQKLPDLVTAFRLEQYSHGGVAVEGWLGTELAKMQWNAYEERIRMATHGKNTTKKAFK